MVLEATYGWCRAAHVIAAKARTPILAHALGVKALEYRRVKNDEGDAADLAVLLRMGRLPLAWIAPSATRSRSNWSATGPSWSGCAAIARHRCARGAGQVPQW